MQPNTRQEILKLALPVSLESTFQLLLGFVNQVIVGVLGTATIGAVGLANNLLFIGILCLNTLGSGAAILASRARGAGDEAAVNRISSFFIGFAFLFSFLLALPLSFGASPLLRWAGASPEVTAIGGPYLSIVALMLPLITTSIVASAVFRTLGHPRLPMAITMASVALTPVLSWLLVFPLGMGAVGAAWAGLIAQALRMGMLLAFLLGSRWGIRFNWPSLTQTQDLLRQALPLVLPLFITEVVFSGGAFLFALLTERIGTEALAVFQIANTLEGVFISAAFGFNSAASILVAQAIGRKSLEEVWHISKSIWHLGMMAGAFLGVLFGLVGFLIPYLYPNTSPWVHSWGLWAAILNGLFLPIKVSNMIFFGTLASGGDTRFLLLSDFITVFVIGLPLAYFLAFGLDLGLLGVYLGRLLGEELSRIAMFIWRYRQGRWFKLEKAPSA